MCQSTFFIFARTSHPGQCHFITWKYNIHFTSVHIIGDIYMHTIKYTMIWGNVWLDYMCLHHLICSVVHYYFLKLSSDFTSNFLNIFKTFFCSLLVIKLASILDFVYYCFTQFICHNTNQWTWSRDGCGPVYCHCTVHLSQYKPVNLVKWRMWTCILSLYSATIM